MPITDVAEYAARQRKVGAVNVDAAISGMNKMTDFPMTDFERRQVEEGAKHPIYIYNISPVHEWSKYQGQLGTILIRKKEADQLVSTPTNIPGVIARLYDAGMRKKRWFLEEGMEVAEDICQCSKKFPPSQVAANLNNWGVFLLPELFEKLAPKEQARIINEAKDKLIESCQQEIRIADQFHEGIPAPMYKGLVGPGHRNALACYNEITGSDVKKPWSTSSASVTAVQQCPMCGAQCKTGVAICFNCKHVLDETLFKRLKGGAA